MLHKHDDNVEKVQRGQERKLELATKSTSERLWNEVSWEPPTGFSDAFLLQPINSLYVNWPKYSTHQDSSRCCPNEDHVSTTQIEQVELEDRGDLTWTMTLVLRELQKDPLQRKVSTDLPGTSCCPMSWMFGLRNRSRNWGVLLLHTQQTIQLCHDYSQRTSNCNEILRNEQTEAHIYNSDITSTIKNRTPTSEKAILN